MILLACLRDLIDSAEYKSALQDKILQKKNVVDGIPERIRLEVKDRQLFSDIVQTIGGTTKTPNQNGLPEPEWRYVNAVEVFRSKLRPLSQVELQQLIEFINQRCVVIYLATSEFDDAFRLFTIVNDRGKQLRRIDILKALNSAPDVITKETVRNKIAQQWEDLEKQLGEDAFESIFHLVRLIILKDKPQADLLKEFSNRILGKKITKGEPFFNLMFDYAKRYNSIFVDRDIVPKEDSSYTRYRALIHVMAAEFGASEWRACLLAFANKFDGQLFYQFCLRIEKVYLGQWVQATRKDGRFSDYSKLLQLIESSKKPEDILEKVTVDSDSIRTAVAKEDLYSAGFGKYFLLRLEVATAEHDSVREFSAKSVEHVLPQNPSSTGYWAAHHDLTKIGKYVNNIGNLVLLSKSKNSSAGNLDFDNKKAKYLKPRVSDYPRSIQVLEYQDWDESTILARTKEAQELVLQDL